MKLKILKTKKEYEEAIREVQLLLASSPKKKSPAADTLELLLLLVTKYEEEHFPIDAPDPIEAIKFRMEQLNLKPKDLEPMIGNKSMVSRILNRKRQLTIDMIRRLQDQLNIQGEVLLKEYKLV
ncbi:MAG: helix-turn-helix domain-containing protein [Cytophagaceae bacterium]|nr:helix-turn-helix domain-containing protein [Cytophagaceae bacterium]